MTITDYENILLEQVRARARAEAALSAEIGDPITPDWTPDHAAIRAYFHQQVDQGVGDRDEQGGAEPCLLAERLADAYALAFGDVLRHTAKRAPLRPPPLDIPAYQGIVCEPYLSVEFDWAYFGGDYNQAGALAKIPTRLVEYYNGSVPGAFEVATGLNPAYIIHWDEQAYIDDADGEEHLADEQENE